MRIRSRNQTYLKLIFTILIIVSPFSYFIYFGIRVGNIYDEILSFQFEAPPPDIDQFLTANYTRLDEMARVYDALFEKNHLPLNYTATCDYVDGNYTEIARYGFSDNGALWTGVAMAGWVFHYIAAINEGNSTDEEYSLEVIKRMVDGMSMFGLVQNIMIFTQAYLMNTFAIIMELVNIHNIDGAVIHQMMNMAVTIWD